MNNSGPKFTIGVEEEYLLVDQETRALVVDPPASLMKECEKRLGDQVAPELLRSQMEIGTKVCNNVQEVRDDLIRLRSNIKEVANSHGYAPIAASTHPFSLWQDQKATRKDRYDQLTVVANVKDFVPAKNTAGEFHLVLFFDLEPNVKIRVTLTNSN